MRFLEDLRFIIGLLFAIIGLLVLGAGVLHPAAAAPGTLNANLVGGAAMTLFAALMILLAVFAPRKEG